jgi:hypothetical protein
MDYIVISAPPYDGRWEFDLEGLELTTREWGWIKRLSGYLPLTIEEGLSDPELICVWACVALTRAHKVERKDVPSVFEQLSDLPLSTIKMETDVEEKAEDDAGPPPSSSSGSGGSSGAASGPSSETLVIPPNRSGTPDSVTSESGPRRLASEHRAS